MTTSSPLDDFKAALSSVARAVTRDAEVEVGFTADAPAQIGKAIKVPTPSRTLPADQVAEARGFSDSYALRMKHHSEKLHAAARPAEPLAAAAFDAMERARIEALGARHMDGMRANLSASLAMRMRSDPISRAQGRDDVPMSSALELMLREALTGEQAPQGTETGLSLVREWIGKEAGGDLTALSMLLDDQAAFGETAKLALRHLDLIQSDEPLEEGSEDGGEEDESEAEESQEEQDSEDGGAGESQVDARAEMAGDQADDGDSDPDAQEMEADGEPEMGGEGDEGMLPVRPNRLPSDIPDFNYLRFTDKHDEIILATELCDADELTRLRAYLDTQMQHLQGAVTKLANRLQRRLMAQQNRAWDFDQEEGQLDAARLARVIVSPGQSLSYKIERDTDFRDTVVTLLIDNSGSMRGRPISIAAISADILARTLERCGVKTEILGFTTRTWKGGQSREDWLAAGRPAHPGRLNDLRHIIYKPADEPYRRARKSLGLMMREGLLKENIDGEALTWAHSRIIGRPEERKILMVISDGAPVDDSTLSVNHGAYLDQHLRQVIDWIENRSPVELCAIGIGHDVTRYYSRAVTIMDAEQLGGTMVEQLAGLFDID
ncbi:MULTISPECIES: cobaltochelatase subunit CobT [unclassified Sphingopyxis]|uniref:cobaltochelatase subunit CobT n=2 Tax=Sphingopyxis TaxID=165697 RepID=UPI002866165A|nr:MULTISPECIES: cobaltochelatase subunit CobT [unclassified Sphingopyxis]MDR6834585.1 cobaltochelatase CobT [Sphingopyxis sp. BE122]MDR7226855.1 cobaltochelatase CobT [Sphingopyxis sp. BE259]